MRCNHAVMYRLLLFITTPLLSILIELVVMGVFIGFCAVGLLRMCRYGAHRAMMR